METKTISSFANVTRLKLLVCLGKGNKNVTQLIENCGLSQSAVSQHLEKLRTAKLVLTKRKGKEIIYKLTSKKTAKLAYDLLKLSKEVDKK